MIFAPSFILKGLGLVSTVMTVKSLGETQILGYREGELDEEEIIKLNEKNIKASQNKWLIILALILGLNLLYGVYCNFFKKGRKR